MLRADRRVGGVIGIAAVALVCAACGAAGGDASAPAAAGGGSVPTVATVIPSGGEPMVFPMRSFRGMVEVADGAYAPPSSLPFAADYPRSAGPPMGVFVQTPHQPGDVEIVEEYDSSSAYGAFRVRERAAPPGSLDQSFIEGIPSICSSTCTDARLVTLQPGLVGALLAGPDGATSVTWLQGRFEMIVIGPPGTFTADTAVAVAKEVARGFDPSTAVRASQS